MKDPDESGEFGPPPTMDQYSIATRAAFEAYREACKAHGISIPHAISLTVVHGAGCHPPEEWTQLPGNDRPQVANFTAGCRTSAHQALAFLVSGLIENGRLDRYGAVLEDEETNLTEEIEAAVSRPAGKVWH